MIADRDFGIPGLSLDCIRCCYALTRLPLRFGGRTASLGFGWRLFVDISRPGILGSDAAVKPGPFETLGWVGVPRNALKKPLDVRPGVSRQAANSRSCARRFSIRERPTYL
jgi:hypothetical protein